VYTLPSFVSVLPKPEGGMISSPRRRIDEKGTRMRLLPNASIFSKLTNKYLMLLWVTIPLCFFFLSLVIVGYLAQQNLKNAADHDIRSSIRFIDMVLNDANDTAELALPLLGSPCSVVIDQLRILGIKHSLVRTVNMFNKGEIYCGPMPLLSPQRQIIPLVATGNASSPDIKFQGGTSLIPGIAVIVLLRYRGTGGVSVVVDTQYMRYMMNLVSVNNKLTVIIRDQFLSPQGQLLPVNGMHKDFIAVRGQSQKFPYELQAQISQERFIQYVIETYGYILFFSIAISIVISLLIRNWLKALTSIKSTMVQGLKRNEFELYFQPVIDAASETCVGVEILTRWRHPTDGMVSPEIFIPLAEESGLIIPLTQQLMRQIATIIARSPASWRENIHIGINISALHLASWQIVEDCRDFQRVVKGKKISLLLELTERQFIEVNDETLEILSALQELGVLIAIDDFGTGYSGLSYLSKMDIDFLKLDQSFVAMIEQENTTRIIVDVVIDLAKKLDMQIIAEGVENCQQKDYLLNKKVYFQQGFLYSRPLPMAQFHNYFNKDQQRRALLTKAPSF
jgi:sensor c-di-GMP phosphodiesterase-like protein